MFKKRLATLTAVLAITSMCASSVFAAEWNTDGGQETVEGSNTVREAAIEVELPGDLMFGINPLRLDEEDPITGETTTAQIVTGQYTVINYSEVPVVVSANTVAKVASGVQLSSTAPSAATGTTEMASGAGGREVFLVQELPVATNGVKVVEGEPILSTNGITITNNTVDGKLDKLISTSGTAARFRLAKFGDEVSANNVSGFKFGGAVDPNGGYQDGDIELTTTYTLKTITENQMADYTVEDGAFETVIK